MSEVSPVMTYQDIEKILPHRYPFLLIDRVDELHPGEDPTARFGRKIRAIKNVTATEPHFTGHFPHWKVMPGVLQIEAMAQACALCCYLPGDEGMDVVIVSVDKARFRVPVVPGDTLEVHCEIIKERSLMFGAKAEIFVRGKKVSEAEILARVFPGGKQD